MSVKEGDYMSKGERLKWLRKNVSLSQTEAAERIGVSKQTLYKYEKDIITNIPSDIVEKISELYGTSPAYIMGWESPAADPNTISFSNEEKDIVLAYRRSDSLTKAMVLRALGLDLQEKGGVG